MRGGGLRVFKQMFAVCYGGDDASYATVVPPGLQGNIRQLAVATGATCVIADPLSDVVCWGGVITSPTNTCGAGSSPSQLFLWNDATTTNGAFLCSNQELHLWDNASDASQSSVSFAKSSPTELCWVTNQTASCSSLAVPGTLSGFAYKIFPGEGGACVQVNAGATSFTCFGSYASLPVAPPANQTLLDATLSGAVACFQWSNGWLCTTTDGAGGAAPWAEPLATLWPLLTSAKSTTPVGLGSVSVYANFSSTGALCAVDPNAEQVVCQGSLFDPQTTNPVVLMNLENTIAAQTVAVASDHICALVQGQNTPWAWILILIFCVLFFVAVFLAWRHYRKEVYVHSYRILNS